MGRDLESVLKEHGLEEHVGCFMYHFIDWGTLVAMHRELGESEFRKMCMQVTNSKELPASASKLHQLIKTINGDNHHAS